MSAPPVPEFSRPISVEALEDDGAALTVEADAEERARLAKRFGLVAIERLTGTALVTPEPGGAVFRLDGTFSADVVQTCVATLEALPAHVEDSFTRLYSAAVGPDDAVDERLDLTDDDPADPLVDGAIDAGEAIAEQLALSLDPFPRKPGISFMDYSSPGDGKGADPGQRGRDAGTAGGPFAALGRLKDKLK